MAARKEPDSPLVAAARALEAELAAFERAARALNKAPLDSQRHLERAGQLLGEIGEGEERLGARLAALVQVIGAARAARESQVDGIRARAQEVERRTAEFQALVTRCADLGERASQLNTRLASVAEGPTPELLESVDSELSTLLVDAEALWTDTRAAGFTDVGKLAESLKQQFAATRARLRRGQGMPPTLH
jgi:chromosome segregation ATPase